MMLSRLVQWAIALVPRLEMPPLPSSLRNDSHTTFASCWHRMKAPDPISRGSSLSKVTVLRLLQSAKA